MRRILISGAVGTFLVLALFGARGAQAASLQVGENSDWDVEPVYCPPPEPPEHPSCCWRWVAGYWTYVTEWVQLPGHWTRYWVPPVYRTYYDEEGLPYTVCVHGGYWSRRWVPGRSVPRRVRRWISGHWQYTGPCHYDPPYHPCDPYPCRSGSCRAAE